MRLNRTGWKFGRLAASSIGASIASGLLMSIIIIIYGDIMDGLAIMFLSSVVVLIVLLPLGLLYGALFARLGWLSMRSTVIVGLLGMIMLSAVFVAYEFTQNAFEDGKNPIMNYFYESLMASPVFVGLMIFYWFYLRHVYEHIDGEKK